MMRLEQCDPILCVAIREEACHLFDQERSRFVDRSRSFVNRGLDGESSHYYSMRHDACPADIRSWLGQIAPRLPDHELDQAYINVYPPGSFIPPHRDVTREGHRAMVVVPLQSHPTQGLTWYGEMAKSHHVIDEVGRAVIFESLAVVHAVPAVTELRLSIVYLYR